MPSISGAEYFPTRLTSEAARETGEKEAPRYITTLCGEDLPLRPRRSPSVFFFSVCFPSLPPLPAVSAPLSNSAGMRPLLSKIHTEQSNYCDNISAWLINCSLCASKCGERRFYRFLSSLFLPCPHRTLAAALPLPIRLFLPFILQLVHNQSVCRLFFQFGGAI